MRTKIVFMLLLVFCFTNLNAQELVSSSGDSFSNSSYSIDWSLGEVATATYSNATYTLNEGFQQTLITVTKINDVVDFNIKVYPNPATNYVKVISETKDLDLTLTDLSGKTLLNKKTNSTETSINFSDYAAGIYLLNITKNNKVETFKIIKK